MHSVHSIMVLYIFTKSFQNVMYPPWVKERTRNTVIQFLTLNYDLDHEPTMVKHAHCTSTYHTWHCTELFVNPTRVEKIYRGHNTLFNLELSPWPWTDHGQTYALHIEISYLCRVMCKYHPGFKRYRVDTKYSHTMFNLELWPLPWTDLG